MANTADSLQDKAIARANEYSNQLQSFIDQIKSAALFPGGYTRPTIVNGLEIGPIKDDLDKLIASTQLTPPAVLATPDLPLLTVPTPKVADASIAVPTFATITVPDIVAPIAPNVSNLSFTGARQPLVNPVAPGRPDISIPDAPSFTNVVMPTITDIVIPSLTAIAPTDTLTAPTGLFAFSEVAYQSALLDSSKAKLLHDLVSGGYGIETSDEAALWARAADRELRGAAIASADVARTIASRGFSVPPGAMFAQIASIQQGAAEKLSSVSREIALKRADMYVENRKFTFSEVRELEQLSINMHLSTMERALNSAKAVADFGIALYNARVAKYTAAMEAFRINVQAYGEQVRAAVSQIEAQRMKLEVVQAEVGVQKARAEVYNVQVDGQKAILDMYRTDVSVMQGLADVERLKLDAFRADVEVFSEQVRAGTLQLQGYEAQTRGNLAQVEVYKTQVGAQLSQAELAKAQASVVESNARVATENLRAAIASVSASADVYRAQSAGVASANESQSRAFASRTEAFRAIAQVYDVMGRVQISDADMTMRAATDNLRANIDQQKDFYNYRGNMLSTGAGTIAEAIKAQLGQVLGIASAVTTSSS